MELQSPTRTHTLTLTESNPLVILRYSSDAVAHLVFTLILQLGWKRLLCVPGIWFQLSFVILCSTYNIDIEWHRYIVDCINLHQENDIQMDIDGHPHVEATEVLCLTGCGTFDTLRDPQKWVDWTSCHCRRQGISLAPWSLKCASWPSKSVMGYDDVWRLIWIDGRSTFVSRIWE